MIHRPDNNEFDAAPQREPSGAVVPYEERIGGPTDLVELGENAPFYSPDMPADGGANSFTMAMLLRAKWWVFGVFAFVSIVVLACVWAFVSPQFRARASIRVAPVVSRIVFKTEDNGFVPLYQSYLNTQVSIILGPTVLQRVLDRDDVRQTTWYRTPPTRLLPGRMSPLERLHKALDVAPRRSTELIDVSLVLSDPKDAKLIVDAVVDTYKTYTDETLRQNDIRRLETLIRERDTLQKEIDGLVATQFRLTALLGTSDPETYRVLLSTQLGVLEAEQESLKRDQSIAEWDEKNYYSHAPNPQTSAPETPDNLDAGGNRTAESKRYASDFEWRSLNMSLAAARYELALADDKFGDLHPRMRELSSGIQHAAQLVREREYQLEEEWLTAQFPELLPEARQALTQSSMIEARTAPSGRERLGHEIQLLSNDIDRKKTELMDAGEIAKEVAHYHEELRYKRELYETVRQRLTAFEMESKAPARITIADYAVQPSAPHRDRRVILSAMALVGALFAGLAAGYFRGTIDPRIHEATDVQTPVQVPFLGKLPLLPDSQDLISNADPLVTESIRMVRTALLKRLGSTGSHVVLITSSSSRAGKTTVAMLLARSLAQLGKKTLLVETDLRRPSIAERMTVEPGPGLAGVLTGTISDEEVIVPTPIAKFDVLPAGSQVGNFNFELLANGVFSACLSRWKESYDFIILDSPPVFPVADARILASQVDGTIMVLRSAHCRRSDVFQAYTDLLAGGGKILGTVFIGTDTGIGYGDYAEGRKYLETVQAR